MADKTLRSFASNVQALARPNRFWVTVLAAPNLADFPVVGANDYRYLTKTASIPEVSADKISINWFGRQTHIVGDPKFGDFEVVFRAKEDWKLIDALYTWLESVGNREANTRGDFFAATGGAKGTLKVEQFTGAQSETGTAPTAVYFLHEVFPKSITPIEFSTETNSAIAEISVSFSVGMWGDADTISASSGTVGSHANVT